MKIISLLGAFAVLSLIIVPACAQPSLKGCACMPGDCPAKPVDNCCSQSSDSHISMSCTCPGQVASYSGIDYYDPDYSHFSKSRLAFACQAGLCWPFGSSNAGAFCSVLPLPPIATTSDRRTRMWWNICRSQPGRYSRVLASDGPLTQKDIISKTELPPRTVRYALGRLRGEEMLEERFCFSDARQSLYRLNGMDTR